MFSEVIATAQQVSNDFSQLWWRPADHDTTQPAEHGIGDIFPWLGFLYNRWPERVPGSDSVCVCVCERESRGAPRGGVEGHGPPWDLKNTIFSGFLPLNYVIYIFEVCFLCFLLCGRTEEACSMVNTLRKVDLSHPTGHYTIHGKKSPLEKILGAPLCMREKQPSGRVGTRSRPFGVKGDWMERVELGRQRNELNRSCRYQTHGFYSMT